MDFHPKHMLVTCVYLACKVEEFNVSISDFVKNVRGDREKAADVVLNYELLLMQQLKYHLTVHNPYRPIEGLMIDLKARCLHVGDPERFRNYIENFIESSYFTDACFLYSPSQIALAAIVYAATKYDVNLDSYLTDILFIEAPEKVENLRAMMTSLWGMIRNIENPTKEQVKNIEKKLEKCRNEANNMDSQENKKQEDSGDMEPMRKYMRLSEEQKLRDEAFIQSSHKKTSAEPGLARDLLEGHSWDLKTALNAYYIMKGILPYNCDSISKSLPNETISETAKKALSVQEKNNFNNAISVKFNSEPSLSSPSVTASSTDSSVNSSPSKLAVSKGELNDDLIDEICPKKLFRGISRATDNVNLVSKARSVFAQDFEQYSSTIKDCSIIDTPEYTFTLPDLSIHSDDFKEFLEKDLIEKSTLISLENAGRLNWWADLGASQRLWPLATTGDGNCFYKVNFLTGMWGFHDRLLTLRKALHTILVESSSLFYRRWRWQSSLQNKEAGLILCEEEWQKEWQSLLKMASTEPRVRACVDNNKSAELNGGKKSNLLPEEEIQPHVYESLEEIHILALAHVLKRPIIVIADTMLKDVTGEPFAPIPFGGIYLPLECTADCHRSPLCLTYDAAHFSALVAMDKETYADKTPHPPAAIPLTDPEGKLLPLQFAIDPGVDVKWGEDECDDNIIAKCDLSDNNKLSLLKMYLDVKHIQIPKKIDLLEAEADAKKRGLRNGYLEKSQTLPSNFEFDDSASSSDAGTSVSGISSNGVTSTNKGFVAQSKSKAAKQLHIITKHFGSLGRSMSKKIKRNFGSLTRRGTSFRSKSSNSSPKHEANSVQTVKQLQKEDSCFNLFSEDEILVAVLHTEKRHEYHEDMIRNYLNTARIRFLNHKKEQKKIELSKEKKDSKSSSTSSSSSSTSNSEISSPVVNFATQCVNTGCNSFGTSATNYLCSSCYCDQKKELSKCVSSEVKSVSSDNSAKVPLETIVKKTDTPNCVNKAAVIVDSSANI
ncbi:OTU domain-containing protein 7B-like protein [Leptotrombidium deliense]|uniref:ubiquitinyl hydrolase 1 n=1 Tax=Leptotrombidium deliense TaxID=299467 RepID=A0A443SRW2_9ACAR|nr:OTU domain-containing protein 7B-like protein [Leptotrombidium deliense]